MNTFIRTSFNLIGATLVSALVLVGCASPESNKDDSPSTPQVTVPTAANLVGTWKSASTFDTIKNIGEDENGDDVEIAVSESSTTTWVFTADGKYDYVSTSTYTPKDTAIAVFYTSFEEEGTFAVSEGAVKLSSSRYRNSDTLNPADGEWDDLSYVSEDLALIVDGKLKLNSVYKAEGTPSSIVGTWSTVSLEDYLGGDGPQYTKVAFTFNSDMTMSRTSIDSTDTVFDEIPDTRTGTYTVAADGTIAAETEVRPYYFKIFGSYLVQIGSNGNFGYTKQ